MSAANISQSSVYNLIKTFLYQELDLGDYSSLFLTTVPPKPGKKITLAKKNIIASTKNKSENIVIKNKKTYKPKYIPELNKFKLPAGDKKSQLDALKKLIGKCDLCAELVNYRNNIVFGAGNPNAEVLFVGEAPGRDEDIQGIPFVGRSGRLLTDIIEKGMKISRDDVYIANILKCRPPNNRDPLPNEEKNCTPFLNKQIDIIQPKVIITLGRYAAQYLLNTTVAIGKLRGNFHDYKGIPVMPTYHPAYLIRNYSKDNRLKVWNDIRQVVELLAEEK